MTRPLDWGLCPRSLTGLLLAPPPPARHTAGRGLLAQASKMACLMAVLRETTTHSRPPVP